MSLQIKRPRGITVFVILGILDAAAMAIFLGFFYAAPDYYNALFEEESNLSFEEYATIPFNERVLEFSIFVIAIDIVAIRGMLLANPFGRKLAAVCAILGIGFNVIIFGIPGLASNSILLWYLHSRFTKDYFAEKS